MKNFLMVSRIREKNDNITDRSDSPGHPPQPFGVAAAGGRPYGRAHVRVVRYLAYREFR